MKNIAALIFAVIFSASTIAAHAAPINVFGSGVNILLDGTAINMANINLVRNGFSVLDHGSLFTITYVTTPTIGVIPSVGLLNITDVCTTAAVSVGPVNTGTPCQAEALSFTDTNFGSVNIGLAVALGAQETLRASGNTASLNIAQNASIGLDTAAFIFVKPVSTPSAPSPVPEPGTLSLMGAGILGAVGALRRRFVS